MKTFLTPGQYFLAGFYPLDSKMGGRDAGVYKHIKKQGKESGTCEWRQIVMGSRKSEKSSYIVWGSAENYLDPSSVVDPGSTV